jgi:hypothetical protein
MREGRIAFKTIGDLPTFEAGTHTGVLMWDETVEKLYIGGASGWEQIASGDGITLNDPIINGQIETTGTSPSIAANANLGATGSAAIAGNDTVGRITLIPGGAGIGAGNQAEITFAVARPDTSYEVFLQPFNDGAANISGPVARPASLAGASWAINRASVALVSGTTYIWSYLVLER